jgi:molybdate transport system substrate-binding protein
MRVVKFTGLLLCILLIILIAGCEANSTAEQASKEIEISVSAASSLMDAMEEIKAAYEKEKPNIKITYHFGSSGSLEQQIEQGEAADVFVSAAAKQMKALQDKGLIIEDTRKDFLENEIVLVIPVDSSVVADFSSLSNDKVKKIALGEPKSVPAGQYAQEVLLKLNLLDSIRSKAVYGKDAREVLAWVETGNADAGIVYETDAKSSEKVKVAAKAPEESHEPIRYPAAVLKACKNQKASVDYINYLYGSKAKPIFERIGFTFLL